MTKESLLVANTCFFLCFNWCLRWFKDPFPSHARKKLKSWSFCSFNPCHCVLPCYSCWSFRKPTDRPSKSLLESSSNASKAFFALWNHRRWPSGKLTIRPENGWLEDKPCHFGIRPMFRKNLVLGCFRQIICFGSFFRAACCLDNPFCQWLRSVELNHNRTQTKRPLLCVLIYCLLITYIIIYWFWYIRWCI